MIISWTIALSGCGNAPATGAAASSSTIVTAALSRPGDPLLAFAATSGPGSSGVVGGQAVRVVRAYTSAAGRDCRELLVGTGLGERSAVACRDEAGDWSLATPLLRGGGLGRP